MAVIVKPGTTSRNVGRFVEILRPGHISGDWEVRMLGGPGHMLCGDGNVGFIADDRLKPIRPAPDAKPIDTTKDLEHAA